MFGEGEGDIGVKNGKRAFVRLDDSQYCCNTSSDSKDEPVEDVGADQGGRPVTAAWPGKVPPTM